MNNTDKYTITPVARSSEHARIASDIHRVETMIDRPILFKKQKAWKACPDNPVKLINASVNKTDMPERSVVCWVENGSYPVWRFTHCRTPNRWYGHLEFTQYPSHELTYVNGTGLWGTMKTMQDVLEVYYATRELFQIIYSLEV